MLGFMFKPTPGQKRGSPFAEQQSISYHPESSSAAWKIEKQQLGLWWRQLIFMFYIIPCD